MRYGADGFEVLLEDIKIDEEKLKPETLYLQLIGVQPYYGEVLEPWRVSFHHQQFGLDRFVKESAWTDEGNKKQADDIATQRKKKTIYTVKFPFPYVESRIQIIDTEEVSCAKYSSFLLHNLFLLLTIFSRLS